MVVVDPKGPGGHKSCSFAEGLKGGLGRVKQIRVSLGQRLDDAVKVILQIQPVCKATFNTLCMQCFRPQMAGDHPKV